ncbi:VOC family protein [Pseudaestuariivita sp.]|uniref:VOC family protein n=1 Tax=Pseudaestuariivita sp. TaxID=2211669 RepID=UPI004058F28F
MQHLHAVALLVPDYDAGLAFYVDTLGFELVSDEDQGGGKRWVLIRPPGGEACLLLARAVGEQTRAIGNQFGGRVGLFLHTEDFARDHARMLAAGVTFEEAPRHEPYGTVAVFRDPWGTRWDLLQLVQASE